MQFELTDSRRLTGANLYWEYPSAIIDVSIKCAPEEIIAAWEKAAREWLDPVGYAEQKTCYRVFDGGASLLISAPIEHARIDPDNIEILIQHLKCAAFELPFAPGEYFGAAPADDLLAFLAEEGHVRQAGDERNSRRKVRSRSGMPLV